MAEQTPGHVNANEAATAHPIWVWLVPVALMLALVFTYLISPAFYLEYILHSMSREHQLVEIITFGSALLGGLLLVWSARLAWKRGGCLSERSGAVIIGIIAAASLFFAGEEISWGQSYLGWKTPESIREFSGETNLHNSFIPVNSLGSVFLAAMFFVLPLVWHLKWPRALPAGWGCAIAEGPVIFSMACAFGWRLAKKLYQNLYPDYKDRQTYIDFFEQLNEHKEMIVAVTLLMYGVYRIRKLS